jgi:MFS superfamily sulfate permease-like transporter
VITGHLGIAAAVRSGWRDTSLLWLLPASIAPDLLDIAYALVGICSPFGLYSHTVPVVALLALVVGGAAYVVTGSRPTAMAAGALVLLHLPADLITGYKHFWPGGSLTGLDLYRSPALDFVLEAFVALGGWWLLRRDTRAPRWATAGAAAATLVLVQAAFDSKAITKPSACEAPALKAIRDRQ